MHDLVTYHNDLSCLGLRGFSAMELDVLMSLLRRCRDKGTSEITIDFFELKEIMNIKRSVTNEEFSGMLISMNRKLLSLNMMISEESKIYQFTLFTCFGLDTEEKSLEIAVNQRFSYLINSLTSNFTTFELEQFVNLRSTYSKELYRLLKRFKNTGVWKVSIEKFRKLLDIPEGYRMSEIDKKVLNVTLRELKQHFRNLKVKKIRSRRQGRPITDLEFTFQPQNLRETEVLPGQISINDAIQEPQIGDIKALINSFGVNISDTYAKKIDTLLKAEGKGLEYLEEILQYSKKQEIKNLQGWLLSVVKSFEVPKQVAKKGGFTDYEQRDYDFEKIMEEIEG